MSASARSKNSAGGPDRRRQARMAAVQALYQVELGQATPRSVIAEFLQHRLDEEVDGWRLGRIDRTLFGELVQGVPDKRADLGDMVSAVLDTGWSLERLETILRLILFCGAYELAERPSVPARTVINEYVELAHAFFEDKEPGFVNGILDRLAHRLRAEEFTKGSRAG